jgi:DNA-directed RNA polymerase subunit RPC12/RpoP
MTERYGEAFEFDIRNILSEGDLARRELFRWWLEGSVFTCRRCKGEFSLRIEDVDQDDEIVCPPCAGRR